MSHGTMIRLIKFDRNLTEEDEKKFKEKEEKLKKAYPGDIEYSCENKLVSYGAVTVDWKTKKVYKDALVFSFISTFDVVRDYFSLNPYRVGASDVILDAGVINDMLKTINYYLSEDYSVKTEHLLENEFLYTFAELYTPYLRWRISPLASVVGKASNDEEDDEDSWNLPWYSTPPDEEVYGQRICLKRFRAALESYLYCDNDDGEYLLLLSAWG